MWHAHARTQLALENRLCLRQVGGGQTNMPCTLSYSFVLCWTGWVCLPVAGTVACIVWPVPAHCLLLTPANTPPPLLPTTTTTHHSSSHTHTRCALHTRTHAHLLCICLFVTFYKSCWTTIHTSHATPHVNSSLSHSFSPYPPSWSNACVELSPFTGWGHYFCFISFWFKQRTDGLATDTRAFSTDGITTSERRTSIIFTFCTSQAVRYIFLCALPFILPLFEQLLNIPALGY